MHKIRKSTDPNNPYRTLVWMLPQDIIDNTVKAFSVSATGYTQGAPTGRYFAPANGPDCLETAVPRPRGSTWQEGMASAARAAWW